MFLQLPRKKKLLKRFFFLKKTPLYFAVAAEVGTVIPKIQQGLAPDPHKDLVTFRVEW